MAGEESKAVAAVEGEAALNLVRELSTYGAHLGGIKWLLSARRSSKRWKRASWLMRPKASLDGARRPSRERASVNSSILASSAWVSMLFSNALQSLPCSRV